ncbi:hypothetical protein N3K66_004767 [Trichothecium roseum]|uniref:Uncharacterized protein n=1 Tax=Trichothecium roseum TaxID=47278 RepID=A0ACC0V259_9HYPO|nr:hypothetical protein N3K66_004767 [Trichothecium roseum]
MQNLQRIARRAPWRAAAPSRSLCTIVTSATNTTNTMMAPRAQRFSYSTLSEAVTSTPEEAQASAPPAESATESAPAEYTDSSSSSNSSVSTPPPDDVPPPTSSSSSPSSSSTPSSYSTTSAARKSPYVSSRAAKPASTTTTSAAAAPTTATSRRATSSSSSTSATGSSSSGLPVYKAKTIADGKAVKDETNRHALDVDWTSSYHGVSTKPVTKQQFDVLMKPLVESDIEVKPDGIIYLPEIKYRRILNEAFGPMGWGLIPRGEAVIGSNIVTREYALVVDGRFVSQVQGENAYYNADGLPSAVEGCKSNALMRCCKDLGIASELWDPVFIRSFRKKSMESAWVEHFSTKKKRIMWFRKGAVEVPAGYKKT